MYADDLLLLSLSIVDLQYLVDICTKELKDLDMKINSTKSCCLRIGPRTSIPPVNIVVDVDSSIVSWNNELKYLGLTYVSGCKLRCNFHLKKVKYFGSVNNIFCKIGNKSAADVILSLIYSKCTPILL